MWEIQLLDNLRIHRDGLTLQQFRTHKTGSLLAYLAFYSDRYHQRDALIEMLWPDSDIEAGRNLLRVTLSSLRRHLEPSSIPKSSVLAADRSRVQLSSRMYHVDTQDFATLIEAARVNDNPEEQTALLEKAAAIYRGPLLQEYDETWIHSERERLAESAYKALLRLVNLMLASKRQERALDYAGRAVRLEPAREEGHRVLMRMYGAMNRPERGLKQYAELEMILHDTFNRIPSATTQEVFRQLERQHSEGSPARSQASSTPHASASSAPGSLPSRFPGRRPIPFRKTLFFGREEEREKLCALLFPRCERLVTITGMAGCGKTRTALEVVRDLTAEYPDRIWFVDLSDTVHSERLLQKIILALDPQRAESASPAKALEELIAGSPALLVLDNFEQLLAPTASRNNESPSAVQKAVFTILDVLDALPDLTLLITSRQALGIVGERELALTPLPTPAPDLPPDKLMEFASIRIFVDRASAANPAFRVGSNNSAHVASLCRDLEGIPLALELAAEWACTLTPAQMRQFVTRRFSLLVSRRADQTQRHRALYSALEQSYILLDASLRRLFSGLSIFRNGWSLEAAAAICGEETSPAAIGVARNPSTGSANAPAGIPILTGISELQRRSMLYCVESDNTMRYYYLETLREFAADQLSQADLAALKMRHARYFTDWAESLAPQIIAAVSERVLDQFDLERANLRAVFDWCVETRQAEFGLRLIAALHLFWNARGYYSEAREQIKRIMALPEALKPTPIRARALQAAWMLAKDTGDMPSVMALMQEGLATLRALNDEKGAAGMLNNMGNAAICLGDLDSAEQFFFESLGIHRRSGNSCGMAHPLNNLGEIAMRRGDADAACRYFMESLSVFREAGNEEGIAGALLNCGRAYLLNGEVAISESSLLESLRGWLRLRNIACIQEVLKGLIEVKRYREEWEETAVLIGQVERLQQQEEKLITAHSPERLAAHKIDLKRRLPEFRYEDCWREGNQMSLEEISHFVACSAPQNAGETLSNYAVAAK